MKSNIPSEIITSIRLLNDSGINAVLAGGAVRDHHCGKPVKDYDIFMYKDDKTSGVDHVSLLSKRFGYSLHQDQLYLQDALSLDDSDIEYEIGGILLIDTLVIEGHTVQLIQVDRPPITYIEDTFDIGLCMCYCNGTNITYTKQFFNDVNHQTLTICGNFEDKYKFERVVDNHLQRIKLKYPTFKVIVADHNLQYVDEHIKSKL